MGTGVLPAGWDLVASSGFARVALAQDMRVYYKEFLPRGRLEKLKACLRGSRATRARRNSEQLQRAGFQAPDNLAWGTLPGGRQYLFTRAVPGRGITHWLRRDLAGRDRQALALRRQLLRQFGSFVGRVHAAGFVHGDLRPSNALAEHDGDEFHFSLIDNERNRQKLPPARKGLCRNLMQLNMLLPADLTGSDRWRFFLAWRREMQDLSDEEARALAVQAYHWARRRLQAKGKL